MSHEEIKLVTPTRMFTFEQLSRDIDKIDDIEVLRDMAKSHIKLYLKQQEVVSTMGLT